MGSTNLVSQAVQAKQRIVLRRPAGLIKDIVIVEHSSLSGRYVIPD